MKIKRECILIYVEYKNQVDFFIRFIPACNKFGMRIVFLTNKLSLKYLLNKKGFLVYLTFRKKADGHQIEIKRAIEIVNKQIDLLEGQFLYFAVLRTAGEISRLYNIKFIFFINGEKVADYALKKFAKIHGIKTLFFELANIPGKIFVDPKGTSANSLLFSDILILDNFNVLENEYIAWRKEYLTITKTMDDIPQSLAIKRINNPLLFLDEIGHKYLKLPRNKKERLLNKILTKVIINRRRNTVQFVPLPKNYTFFPTQIASDTQLQIFSEFTNESAIKYALNLAKQEGLELVVKIHPAEYDRKEVKKIYGLKEELRFTISDCNTFRLLANAQKIVTINSTVGLEGLIAGKEVVFLGKTFYNYFTNDYLKKYLLGYLISIDYFSHEVLTIKRVEEILSRTDLVQ